MIDFQRIIDHFYPVGNNDALRNILLVHSKSVADLASQIIKSHPELGADHDFAYAAAMLHDIGIVRCDAAGISCFGTEPYICHGTLGAQMIHEVAVEVGLSAADEERLSRVCARHTGTGLTAKAITEQQLPLPAVDLLPETIEEKIVCYADKFFSKTHLDRQKTYEQAQRSLAKFGQNGLVVFESWHTKYKPSSI